MCYGLEDWSKVASISASFATALGIIGGAVGAFYSIRTYMNNNSLRKIEIIHKLYNFFLEKEMYDFYELIKSNKPFSVTEYEPIMNEALTYFDELEYHFSRKLIDEKSLEYFAAEILNFSKNDTVKKYIKDIEKKYEKLEFHKDIVPFSGFTALVKRVNEKYKYKKTA